MWSGVWGTHPTRITEELKMVTTKPEVGHWLPHPYTPQITLGPALLTG